MIADDASFLGTGWRFPPAFTRGGADVLMAAGTEDIEQSLRILLTTRLGERTLQEDYGCALDQFLFESVDQSLVNNLTRLISDGILYFEPRIDLDALDVSPSEADAGLLLIRLSYTVRATNSRFNMVYPFYINEATLPG